MRKIILLFLFFPLFLVAQEAQPIKEMPELKIYPEPPGGLTEFRQNIANELMNYLGDIKEPLQVIVKIRFVVNEEGLLSNFEIIDETVNKYNLGQRAIFVIKKSPKWKPGSLNGKLVKVYYSFPLKINIS